MCTCNSHSQYTTHACMVKESILGVMWSSKIQISVFIANRPILGRRGMRIIMYQILSLVIIMSNRLFTVSVHRLLFFACTWACERLANRLFTVSVHRLLFFTCTWVCERLAFWEHRKIIARCNFGSNHNLRSKSV